MKLKSSKSLKVCSNMTIRLKLLLGLAVALAVVTGGIVGAIKTQEVEAVSLPRFSGHLDCGDAIAQRGVQDGYEVPARVPQTCRGVGTAA